MGFWGSGLYGNDSSCDVRDGYLDFLKEGLSNEEAYEKTIEKFHDYLGDQDEPLLWFALAETQWRMGRLQPDVKEKALAWIEKGGCLELWEDEPKGAEAWTKTLQNLKDKLNQQPPKEKKIRKPPPIDNNPWNLHDVYAYQFHGIMANNRGLSGKYILLQKIGEGEYKQEGLCMWIHVFDRVFDELPSISEVKELRLLPLTTPRVSAIGHAITMNKCIYMDKKIHYPKKQLTFLGNYPCALCKKDEGWTLNWASIDYYLIGFYFVWQGLTYEVTKEGSGYYKNLKGKLEGTGLGFFSHDEIIEVRDIYVSALCKGLSSQAAFEKTTEEIGQEYLGKKKEPLFWYALADVQWDLNRLLPEVHSKATEWISKSGGLDLCEENPYSRADWEETLECLQFKLKKTPPWQCPLIKLRQQQKSLDNRWKINDIYAYEFHGEESKRVGLAGKYILIQKIGTDQPGVGALLHMLIHVFDRVFDQMPALSDLEQLRILPLGIPKPSSYTKKFTEGVIYMNQSMLIREEEDYPTAYLTFIGNQPGPANRQHFSRGNFDAEWGDIDNQLVECYQFWKGKAYVTVEEGIYRYISE